MPGEAEDYGDRYTVDFLLTRGDREARVRISWIILRGESAPRLTSFRYAMCELLSVVALLENVAVHDLLRGQVGTVVERLAPAVYEVEFSDDEGRTYASLSRSAISCFSFIMSRAVRRLDNLDARFASISVVDNPADPFLDGGRLFLR